MLTDEGTNRCMNRRKGGMVLVLCILLDDALYVIMCTKFQ